MCLLIRLDSGLSVESDDCPGCQMLTSRRTDGGPWARNYAPFEGALPLKLSPRTSNWR